MTSHLLIPSDVLNLGSGKSSDFGVGGETLLFPLPATTAGALRAAADPGRNPFHGIETTKVSGPVLVSLKAESVEEEIAAVWFAKPADALPIGSGFTPAVPGLWPDGVVTDAQGSAGAAGELEALWPVSLQRPNPSKPDKANPWWPSDSVLEWLTSTTVHVDALGNGEALKTGRQTHVVIDDATQTHLEGGLFRTAGVDFGDQHAIWISHNLPLNTDWVTVGGKGHTSRLRPSPDALPWNATKLSALTRLLESATFVRVVLTSPAIFEKGGWRPDWLQVDTQGALKGCPPVQGCGEWTLRAALVDRMTHYSGWTGSDGKSAGPGRSFRVVPAGAVYWFEVPCGDGAKLLHQNICDGQWAASGWGDCMVGTASAPVRENV